jgi:hypothetical protein
VLALVSVTVTSIWPCWGPEGTRNAWHGRCNVYGTETDFSVRTPPGAARDPLAITEPGGVIFCLARMHALRPQRPRRNPVLSVVPRLLQASRLRKSATLTPIELLTAGRRSAKTAQPFYSVAKCA